jgi:outer membrane lipoprotein-sorting protein
MMLVLLPLLLSAAPTAGAADARFVLAALEKSGRQLRTLRADFEQVKLLSLLDEREVSTGVVLLAVPGRLRWDYKSPQPGALLVKDGRFARYVPQSKQVFRGAARGEADLLVGFGPGAADLGRKYDVSLFGEELVGGRWAYVLDLVPRAGQPGLFSAIRLWVDRERGIPAQTRLSEPTGDSTTVRFDNLQVNTRLPSDAFELALPRDVVEERVQ